MLTYSNIILSLKTFAKILAAAIDKLLASPFIIESYGMSLTFNSTASTNRKSGFICKFRYEFFIANNAASNIRSEEHTSELQSRGLLVCRLVLGKNKTT